MAQVGSAEVSLTIEKWRSPSEAIWGRWVMHSTCLLCAELAQARADGARGVPADAGVDLVEHERRARDASARRAPPRPRRGARTLMSASITRESSPPEAISRSGPAGTPGLGAIMNSTASPPDGPALALARASTSKVASPIASDGELLAHRERQARGGGCARVAQER